MRADRLVAILLLLQRYGIRTAPQLAKHLEVSERTILRDISALSASGIPVYAERGPHGGFRLVEGFSLDLTGMRTPELRTFFLGGMDGLLADLGWHHDAQTARDKLMNAVAKDQKSAAGETSQRFHIDETGWFTEDSRTPFLRLLQDAIWDNVRLNVSYQKPIGPVTRVISPLALVAKAGIWYLVAERNSDIRVYRVDRIIDVEPINEHFERPGDFDLNQFWNSWTKEFEYSLPKYKVLLWIESDAYDSFVQRTPFSVERASKNAPQGYVAALVTFETIDMACTHILGCGFKLYVVEPLDLRTVVMERARQILNVAESLNLEVTGLDFRDNHPPNRRNRGRTTFLACT